MRSESAVVSSVLEAEDFEAARRDVELLVVVGKVLRLFGAPARLVVMADRDPEDDVASGGRVERSLHVDGPKRLVGAVEADVGALLDAVAPADRRPQVPWSG